MTLGSFAARLVLCWFVVIAFIGGFLVMQVSNARYDGKFQQVIDSVVLYLSAPTGIIFSLFVQGLGKKAELNYRAASIAILLTVIYGAVILFLFILQPVFSVSEPVDYVLKYQTPILLFQAIVLASVTSLILPD